MLRTNNYRAKVFVAICVVVLLGILSRAVPIGLRLWDKYFGDALYAVAFYLASSVLWPIWRVETKTLSTAVYVVAIEAFQITGVPAQLKQSSQLVIKLFAVVVLGSSFSWWDLLAYAVGIAGIIAVDWRMRRQGRPAVDDIAILSEL
jgi:hypothetical protein